MATVSDDQGNNNPHDDVMKWKHFPRYWPFVQGIHRSPVNLPHTGQWRVTWSFALFFDLCLNKRLSKQSWGWWFETPLCLLRRHCNAFYDSKRHLLLCAVMHIMGAMAPQISGVSIVYSTVFKALMKESIIALRHSPLSGDRWIPLTKGQ